MKRTLLTLAAALFLLPASAQQVPEWLKEGILYHIYPSSFKDSDGDGIGDLEGIRSKLPYVKSLGANTIWLSPVFRSEFEDGGYDITDFYRIDPRFGTNSQLVQLVREAHDLGIRVCLDLVAGHTSDKHPWFRQSSEADPELQYSDYYIWSDSKDSFPTKKFVRGDAARDGNYMKNFFDIQPALNYGYLHPDPAQPWQQGYDDPGPTAVRNELKNIISFWMDKGVDGFRCDMAEMVPVEFWGWAIPQVKEKYPHLLFIAEVYNPYEYRNYLDRGHFDYLYDKVGLYDTLRTIVCSNESATAITRCWQSLGGIEQRMLNFLENHDEQRIASDFFAGNPWKAIPALVVSACMNTNPMMIYFGQEFGEPGMDHEGFSGRDGRTTIFDYWSVGTIRRWRDGGKFDGRMLTDDEQRLHDVYQRVLTLCRQEEAIAHGLFFDLMYANIGGGRCNEHRQYAFLRKHGNEVLLIVANFDSATADVAVNIPSHAFSYLQMPQVEHYQAVDLLTGVEETVCLLPYKATDITVKGYSAKILKFTL